MMLPPNNAICTGWVKHTRTEPVTNTFKYRIFKPLVNLDQLESAVSINRWWSIGRFNAASYRRRDHFGDPDQALAETVRDQIQEDLGRRPTGPVLMLAHWRYWGYAINPITLYFCYSASGQLDAILSEVTNTPWGEKCTYALNWQAGDKPIQKFRTEKIMHVSPFLPMNMFYHWSIKATDEQLIVHLENHQDNHKKFAATLSLQPKAWTKRNTNKVLWHYPLMTVKVVSMIYWQAIKLWFKKVKVVDHPGEPATTAASSQPRNPSNDN